MKSVVLFPLGMTAGSKIKKKWKMDDILLRPLLTLWLPYLVPGVSHNGIQGDPRSLGLVAASSLVPEICKLGDSESGPYVSTRASSAKAICV